MGSDGKQRGLEALRIVYATETDWGHGAHSPCTLVGDHGRNAMIWLSKRMTVLGDA